jgi:hypothetical protein
MEQAKLAEILAKHKLWEEGKEGGERAALYIDMVEYDHVYMVDEEMVVPDHFFYFFKKAEKYLLNKGYVRISDPWEDFEGGRSPVYELKTALGLNYIATISKIPVAFGTGEEPENKGE